MARRPDPEPATIAELQAQLDTFRGLLQHRPAAPRARPAHPAQRPTTPDPKPIPTGKAPRSASTSGSATTASTRNGKLTLRHNSRLHHIGIGRRQAGTRVLILARDLHLRIITEHTGELIRELELDPTRDYQPQART